MPTSRRSSASRFGARSTAAARFAAVARALGISRQAAHRRYRDLPTDATRRPTQLLPQAREVLRLARAEAERTGATTVDGMHVVLACVAAGHLRADGLMPAITRRVVAVPPPASRRSRPPFGLALVADLQGHHGPIGVAELLNAACEDRAARRLFRQLSGMPDPAVLAAQETTKPALQAGF